MPRRLRYQVAASLDGFIAGPHGEHDWIVADELIDFGALFREFDTAVMGRKTYQGGNGAMTGMDTYVFSRTLPPAQRRRLHVTDRDPREVVAELKAREGKDIWLFGGGGLFRTLLDAGLVDTVEVAVMPVLLGEGIPLLPPGSPARLRLADHRVLAGSGTVMLAYAVEGSDGAPPSIAYVRS